MVAEGNIGAFEALYERYGGPAYSLARRMLVDQDLAEDVVQEVFLALWRDAARFDRARGSVARYVLSMTHHQSVDRIRREERHRSRRTSAEALCFEPDPASDVEALTIVSVRAAHVRGALSALPARERQVLALMYFGGYTQVEVADLLGIPLGTVKTRGFAGMRRLRRLLGDDTDARKAG